MNTSYKNPTSEKAKGFTIIEVVLVLAIAGLIFLMVFVALPALQRGQRDAQRKSDLTRISVQMTSYLTSTRGSIPTTNESFTTFVKGFLKGTSTTDTAGGVNTITTTAGNDYQDPNGNNYTLRFKTEPTQPGQIGYYPKSNCDVSQDEGIKTSQAARDFAFTIILENQTAPFCLDNKA